MGVMKVDVASKKQMLLVLGLCLSWLILCLIIGGAGPTPFISYSWSAYNCSNGVHYWDPVQCDGVQLVEPNTNWNQTLPAVNLMNRFWVLQVTPYSLSGNALSENLNVEVTVLAQDPSQDADTWYITVENDTVSEKVTCTELSACSSFPVVIEGFINYPVYKPIISFPSDDHKWLGDVEFTMVVGNDAANRMIIGFRTFYLIVNVLVIVVCFWYLRSKGMSTTDFTWEQRSVMILLFGLLCFNNPFFMFQFISTGSFIPFMNSLLEVAFHCILLFYWLMMAEKIRMEEKQEDLALTSYLPKVALVGIYGILSLAFFAWTKHSIRDQENPVFSSRDDAGMTAFFWIISVLWIIIVGWIIGMCVLIFPSVRKREIYYTRFVFFILPLSVTVFSTLIILFTGSFGSFRRNFAFVYLHALFNIYVYFLLVGYWPSETYTTVGEESTLFYSFGNKEGNAPAETK